MGKINNTEHHATFVTLGASNHGCQNRVEHDFYATDPIAVIGLCEREIFSRNVWECACGKGHISEVLKMHGYVVRSTDLVDRGYGIGGVDFLNTTESFNGDIITNPPYKFAIEFVEKAIETITDGHKVAMLLRLNFLEGKRRRILFDKYPPARVYVASGRINCCRNGDFSDENKKNSGAVAHAWFIWEKPNRGRTELKWFN